MNRRAVLAIVCGGAIIALAMGVRQTFGIFLRPISMDLEIGRQSFGLAMAVQNLIWGALSPFAGFIADRFGVVRVTVVSALLYAAGLALAIFARDPLELNLTLGVIVGIGLSGTTFATIFGAVGRMVSPERRSTALGITGAGGSLGMFVMAPVTQPIIDTFGWVVAMGVLAGVAASASLFVFGLRDSEVRDSASAAATETPAPHDVGFGAVIASASRHGGYWLLFTGFLVCGFHVVFIAVHLPAYLGDKGIPSHVAAYALALIGFFNVIGTYISGRLGDLYSKKNLLAGIYLARAGVIALYVLAPLTPLSTYLFASAIGLLWLSTVPLTSGLVGQMFGVRYMATLYGGVFFSHQVGSFLGARFGGYAYDVLGSYDLMWAISIGLGIVAALLHLPIAERPVVLVPKEAA